MINNYFSIYRDETIELCRTMVIKSEHTAEAINLQLYEEGYPVEGDPLLQKYYLNIAGEYHPTDDVMYITSLDTQEQIAFSKQTLRENKTTLKEYTLRGDYFKRLLARYPQHEMLIIGIINPVDIAKAVNANDYTILTWDRTLIEPQEENLIPLLQEWVNAYKFRYFLDGYTITDELFVPSFLGVMYLNLPQKILNIRLSNCRTPQVHTYHIWSYLASHSQLSDFREFLTYKQAHWFYRNIRYVEKNIGRKKVFDYLVDIVLTERNINIFGHRIEHLVGDILEGENKPEPTIIRFPINNANTEELPRTVSEVLRLEEDLAAWNIDNFTMDKEGIRNAISNGVMDEVPSRVFEIEATDSGGGLPYTLEHTLLNQWIAWSSTGRYRTFIAVSNPFTGVEMQMQSKDAVIAFFYCVHKSFGITLDIMPDVFCEHVIDTEGISLSAIRKNIDSERVSSNQIKVMIDTLPDIGIYSNTEDFYGICTELFDAKRTLRSQVAGYEHYHVRGEQDKVIENIFLDYRATFNQIDLSIWNRDNGYELDSLTAEEARTLAVDIISNATGSNIYAGVSLLELQVAMIDVMKRLTSYDLQFIRTTNLIDAKKVDWPAVSPGDTIAKQFGEVSTSGTLDNVSVGGKLSASTTTANKINLHCLAVEHKPKLHVTLDTAMTFKLSGKSTTNLSVSSAPIYLTHVED